MCLHYLLCCVMPVFVFFCYPFVFFGAGWADSGPASTQPRENNFLTDHTTHNRILVLSRSGPFHRWFAYIYAHPLFFKILAPLKYIFLKSWSCFKFFAEIALCHPFIRRLGSSHPRGVPMRRCRLLLQQGLDLSHCCHYLRMLINFILFTVMLLWCETLSFGAACSRW
jgi:hypothetical protein